jgi:hypothetical protein
MITKRVITDISGENAYLVRWTLPLPFGWSLKLHQILRPDDDRCAHDHPWWMLRIILWGGYTEYRGSALAPDQLRLAECRPWRPWAPWRIYWCGRHFVHRIAELPAGSSWTLALCGPSSGTWGFYTRRGWMPWDVFVFLARSKRVLWCEDGRQLGEDA